MILGLIASAAIQDIRGFRIPNFVSVALVALFFARIGLFQSELSLKAHVLVAAVTLLVLFGFYVLGWFGAGDAKLVTAIMLWAGPEAGQQFIVALAFSGGAFAALLLILRHAVRTKPTVGDYVPSTRVLRWAQRGVCPYGLPILLAAIMVWPHLIDIAACPPS